MKLKTQFLSFFAICVMLLIANTDALAQKKPKLKGTAKLLVGYWVLDDMEFKLDPENTSEELKAQFEEMESQKEMIKTMMAGKMSFTFKADGTCTTINELQGKKEEKSGKWSAEGNKLTIIPEAQDKRVTDILLEKDSLKMFVPKEATKGLITTLVLTRKTK